METSIENVLLGTSGWSYKEWVGPFYAEKEKSLLRAYSKVFSTVEINSTFYRYPSKGMVMGWAKYSPEGFVFAAKIPRLITHEKKLDLTQNVEEDLERFVELLEPISLGGKLDCLLIQLPPKFDYKPRVLEDFFKILPTHIRFTVEFRDSSWMRNETWNLLEKYNVAYAVVDEPLLPPEMHFTADFAYFRWHGKGTRPWYNYQYGVDELEGWVPEIKKASGKVKKVRGYFNNHFHGYAVKNCLELLEMLEAITPQQAEAKDKVERYFKTKSSFKDVKLDFFTKPTELNFESLLQNFVDKERLRRARRFRDSELEIVVDTPSRIEAIFRDYHIVVDLETETILHDCADWSRTMLSKRFCKHVGKLLLTIKRDRATEILRRIYEQREQWQFKPYSG